MKVASVDAFPRLLRHAYSLVFSFEFILVLFLFAGRLKANPRLAWVPIDMTAALLVASVLIAGYILYRTSFAFPRRGLALILAAVVFVSWVVVSLGWTPGVAYARDKSLSLIVLALWPLVACALIVAPEPARVKKFIIATLVLGVLMSVDLVVLALRVGPGRVMIEVGSEYLGVGRVVGLAAPVALLLASIERKFVMKWFLLGCFSATLAAVVLLGGRGPAVAMLAALLVPILAAGLNRIHLNSLRRYVMIFVAMSVVGTASVVLMVGVGLKPATIQRAEQSLTEDSGGNSAAERLRYYSDALDAWQEDPVIGRGVGSFPVLFERADEAFYPHNIFLEVLIENGIIGVVLLLILIVAAVRSIRYTRNEFDWVRLVLIMMFVNAFVNAQVTADLPDNRLLFAVMGLMTLQSRNYGCRS